MLHENTRTTDPATWRANLENSLNVSVFLRWLAVNTVIQNWDTYGKMSHNYYLYTDVDNGGKLTWIPWDNNGSMAEGRQGGALSVSLNEVGNDWPLIRYLIDNDSYEK